MIVAFIFENVVGKLNPKHMWNVFLNARGLLAFLNMLDFYIRKADSTIDNGLPSDQQSRFNCDGNFWLWAYEQNKTPVDVSKLIDKIKSGHIH